MILLPDYNDKYNKVDRTKTTLLSFSYFLAEKNNKKISLTTEHSSSYSPNSTYFIIQYYIIILLPDYNDKYNKVDGTKTTLLSFSYFFSGKKNKKNIINYRTFTLIFAKFDIFHHLSVFTISWSSSQGAPPPPAPPPAPTAWNTDIRQHACSNPHSDAHHHSQPLPSS